MRPRNATAIPQIMADVTLDTLVQAILSLRSQISALSTRTANQNDRIDALVKATDALTSKVDTLITAIQTQAKPMADLAQAEVAERTIAVENARAKAQIDIEASRAKTEAVKAVVVSPAAWAFAVALLILAVAQAIRGMPVDVLPVLSHFGASP